MLFLLFDMCIGVWFLIFDFYSKLVTYGFEFGPIGNFIWFMLSVNFISNIILEIFGLNNIGSTDGGRISYAWKNTPYMYCKSLNIKILMTFGSIDLGASNMSFFE